MEKPKRGFNINIDFEFTNSTTIEKFLPLSQTSLGKKDLSQPLKVLNKHWVENVGDLRLLVQEGQLRSIGLPVRLCVWIETEVSKISRVTDLPPGISPEDVKVAVYDEDVVMSREAPQVFNYDSDFDTNGILYWLGTRGRTAAWQNPVELGCARVTTSGLLENSHPVSCFVGRETVRGVTQSHENAWFAVDFIDKLINPSHYTLRHYDSWDTECLRDWKFEASNDLSTWILIKEHKMDTALHSKGGTATWAVATDRTINDGFWRAFRVIMTGPNSNNHNYLACSGFEIYGELISSRAGAADLEIKAKPLEEKKIPAGAELSNDYVYSHDLDTKGIIHNIGTYGGQRPWVNPGDAGLVLVTASSLMQDSASINYIVGKEVVRCVTKPQPSSWFAVDLIDKTALLTHYTLRHYSSWDTEALRNWRFEASNDTLTWTTLSEHKNDQSLKAKGQPFTWQLTGIKKSYRHFRIFQTGENSNNHHYLSLSGFELYGKLFQADGTTPYYYGAAPKTTQSEFKYMSDFDGRGIIHWLGTNYAAEPWRNPVSRGFLVVRASSLAADSTAISAAVGQDVVRCVTKPEENSWFVIDLLGRSVAPTHYTMRHYSSWDTEALRNWLFQGSNDGTAWTTIREHKDDAALEGKGSTHTWTLTTTQKFSMFRIFQTGPNSNNHHYLALSGFELYGTVFGGNGKKRSHSGDRVSISQVMPHAQSAVKHTGLTWDTTSKGPFIEIFGKTATNAGSLDKWQMARSALSFSTGRHLIGLKVEKDQQTSNTWRFIVGAIPSSLDCNGSTQWVGSKGSWGYIAGTGGKCHHRAQSTPYGAKFGVDDVVGIALDFTAGTIEFYKNGAPQGVAFNKITGPLHIACSLTAATSSISFCDWVEPLDAASDNPDVMMATGSMLSSASSLAATSSILGVSGLSSLSLSGSSDESKESATLGMWDPENKSKFLLIDNKQGIVTNSGSSDKWQSARSLQSFSTGQVELAVEITTSPETPNSWRLIVGVVPASFTCLGAKQWVGAGGSWGYIAGTGGICSNMPVSVAYGEGWGAKGDVIGIKLDFNASTIEFLKNGVSQGVAFSDLRGPVHAAVSLTATSSAARLKIIKATT